MNKENKRKVKSNVTIEQLKKKKQIAIILEITLVICFTIVTILTTALIGLKKNDDTTSLLILSVLAISIIIIDRINSKLKIQIALKQRELKLAEIKKRAEGGS